MIEKTKEEILSEELRTFCEMPEFERTVLAWLKAERENAIHIVMSDAPPEKVHFARGQYALSTRIIERLELAHSRAHAAARRRLSS